MSRAHQLLGAADRILADPERSDAHWRRAASILYRVVLEEALDGFLKRKTPQMQRSNGRNKLACLVVYAPDIAPEVSYAWHTLSEMGHHRNPLGPAPEAVAAQGQVVRRVSRALRGEDSTAETQAQEGPHGSD